jgi:hypothetical protein
MAILPNSSQLKVACLEPNGDLDINDEYSMFIFDEFDYLLTNLRLVCTRDKYKNISKLGGLLTPYNRQVRTYFLSATHNKLSAGILDEVFFSVPLQFLTMF